MIDINHYKLRIIQAIMQCEDQEVLETIEQLLKMAPSSGEAPVFQSPSAFPENTELRDLQQSIQDVFGDGKPV